MNVFRLLGVLLAAYLAYAIHRGEVYAKHGIRGRTIDRSESPERFWVTVVIYAVLCVALVTVF